MHNGTTILDEYGHNLDRLKVSVPIGPSLNTPPRTRERTRPLERVFLFKPTLYWGAWTVGAHDADHVDSNIRMVTSDA